MQQKIELLPCPFCGNIPHTKEWIQRGLPAMRIWCDECSVSPMTQGTKENVIEAWNTRAVKSPPSQNGWIDVKNLPPIEGEYLVCLSIEAGRHVCVMWWNDEVGKWQWHENTHSPTLQFYPEYWQPLPQPPIKGE